MSTTQPVNAASSLANIASKPATTQVGNGANDGQMNQFLKLLTAQLKNQDPMQPTDRSPTGPTWWARASPPGSGTTISSPLRPMTGSARS